MTSLQPLGDDEIGSFDDAPGDAAALGAVPHRIPKSSVKLPLTLVPRRSSEFPFFLENVAVTGAVVFNKAWVPDCWTECKRGRFYTGKGDSGKGEALLFDLVKEVRFLADKGCFRSSELIVQNNNLSKLTSETTQRIESAFWDGEFDSGSVFQLMKALCPAQTADAPEGESSKLTKKQAITLLVHHRVPLMVFDDVEALVCAVRVGSYRHKVSLDDCAKEFLKSYVLCNASELEQGISKRSGASADSPQPPEHKSMMSKEAVVAEALRLKAIVDDSERLLLQDQLSSQHASAQDAELDEALAAVAGWKRRIAEIEAQRKRLAPRSMQPPAPRPPQPGRTQPSPPGWFPVVPSTTDLTGGHGGAFEFLNRFGSTLAESLTKALGGKQSGGPPDTGITLSPYKKRLVYLDKLLSERGFIPFVEFNDEAMKELEMRLPSNKSKSVKLVDNRLCFTDDELSFGDDEASHHMGHWKQGFHFVISRMLKHDDLLVCDPDVIQDRLAFLQQVNDLKIDDGALKLKTINEFLRRVSASGSFHWMPEILTHQLMFTGAYHEATEAAAKKRKFNDGGAPNVTKKQKWEAKKQQKWDAKNKGGAKLDRGTGYQGKDTNKLVESSADERTANGVCPSRLSKSGVCPCKGPPKFCKFTHQCPRHPGEFHPGSQCNKM